MTNPRRFVILGLLAFTVCNLQAQIVQGLSIQLSATTQGPTNENNGVLTIKYETVRVTTKDILQLLGDATSTDFSTNARLAVVDFTSVQVISGEEVFDVSGFFSSEATSDDVSDESVNNVTGKTHKKTVRTEAFSFDDQMGNNFVLDGFATEIFSASAVDDNDGSQRISDRKTLKAAGLGEVNESRAIFSGSITARGKGK